MNALLHSILLLYSTFVQNIQHRQVIFAEMECESYTHASEWTNLTSLLPKIMYFGIHITIVQISQILDIRPHVIQSTIGRYYVLSNCNHFLKKTIFFKTFRQMIIYWMFKNVKWKMASKKLLRSFSTEICKTIINPFGLSARKCSIWNVLKEIFNISQFHLA